MKQKRRNELWLHDHWGRGIQQELFEFVVHEGFSDIDVTLIQLHLVDLVLGQVNNGRRELGLDQLLACELCPNFVLERKKEKRVWEGGSHGGKEVSGERGIHCEADPEYGSLGGNDGCFRS